MSDEFYNPFHFVPAEKPRIAVMARDQLSKTPAERTSHQHVTHDRYVAEPDAFCGRIVCRLRLDSPTVVGAGRTPASDGHAAIVEPYQVLAERRNADGQTEISMEPAIPETTLRGMISSVLEAATSSTLRVLNDTALSIRMAAMASGGQRSEALQAVGRIHVDENGRRCLLPLSFPALERQDAGFTVPRAFWDYEQFAQVKVYLNQQAGLESSTPDNGLIYFLRTTTPPAVTAHRLNGVGNPVTKGPFLVARRGQAGGGDLDLRTRDQWLLLPKSQQAQYIPGVLRNLGKRSCPGLEAHRAPGDNHDRDLPRNVRHQWFVPLHSTVYDAQQGEWIYQANGLSLLDAEEAAQRFESLAHERTHDDVTLPYELRGSLRNDNDKKPGEPKSHEITLRQGDLVCFDLQKPAVINELAVSSIWRRAAGSVWEWFAQIDPDLVPMNSTRRQVTLAEQLFGFVEQASNQDKTPRVKALAGRVRFSSGRLCSPRPDGGYFDEPQVTQILGAPKPPSPQFYFGNTTGAVVHKRSFPRQKSSAFAPLGRKVYLHHDPEHPNWVTEDSEKDKKQKATLSPLRQNLEFVFDVSFDNLNRDELALLIWSLKPTPKFRHRLGMAKPLGLGSVDVQPLALFFVDRPKRYSGEGILSENRYHRISRCDASTQSPLDLTDAALDVQHRYAAEKTVWTQLQEAGPSWAELHGLATALLEKSATRAKAVVERLGDPATTQGVPVHYPRLPDALQGDENDVVRREARLYQWHVWNEERPQPQCLKALTKEKPAPSTLPKQPPFRFFLYSHLSDEQLPELRRLLEKYYPLAYHPATAPLADSTRGYAVEIDEAIRQGMIPVHLGVDRNEKIPPAYLVPNHGAICVTDHGGRWEVVSKFKERYLPISRAH